MLTTSSNFWKCLIRLQRFWADWLYGINLTRAWTLTGRQAGHEGVLSVGRVQTPVLGLVVRRDAEIAAFTPRPFHVLWVDLAVEHGGLRAWWQPGEHHPLDDQGRLLERAPAEALAPTGTRPDFSRLSATEANVFRLIARNVLAQFYPPLETREVKAEFTLLEERFRAQGREILAPGWKPLFTTRDEAPPQPPLREGEAARVQDVGVEDRETRPPEPFNDASLIKAMMNIARYVEDPAVKRTLRDSDGLGTEATRAGIIETLLDRAYPALAVSLAGTLSAAGLPCEAVEDIRIRLWHKLAINAAINPLVARFRIRNGQLRDRPFRPMVEALVAELASIMAAEGIPSPADGWSARVWGVVEGTAYNRASMLQDVLAGRPTEIDAILGPLTEAARRHGLAAPALAANYLGICPA